MSNILEVQEVSKQFGDYTALNNVSLNVPNGSIYGLLGPNGAGKTTLIRIINQITMPDSGVVLFDGKQLKLEDVQYIGYLPEERGLYKTMKVGEQCLYLAQLKGLSLQEAKKQLKYWFEKFEIEGWWNKKIQELSKGMAQKVQFIVTVMHTPKLLIFDEPFSGFDPINANLIKDEILKLRDEGASIIFSTHRMESVEELCDYIALINNSKTILEGPIDKIKNEFQANTYEIVLTTNHLLACKEFEILSSKDNIYNLKINDGFNIKEIINEINDKHEIISFKKEVPSVEYIFIKSVNNE